MDCRALTISSAFICLAAPVLAEEMNFNRIASFRVADNLPDSENTSAEIIDVTEDGMTLVYTDSPGGSIGFIDITEPANPSAAGVFMPEGEPTSVAVIGGHALAGVNTSESYTDPSGYLVEIDVASREEIGRCELPGQPDSVGIAPDGSFLAVAIENERDEDLGDGRVGQLPAGSVFMVDLDDDGLIECDTARVADVTGLADIAPEDPEPEFVSINGENEVVVTLQENNHIVVLSSDGEVIDHFSAGKVTLENVDTAEEGALVFQDTITVAREPDSITWIDDTHFAMANEGDMDGGSRGWTIFSQDGEVVYDAGMSFENAIIEVGHYPEGRSGNKGVEPESVTFDVFDGTPFVFVGAERASIVGVYDITDPANPELRQLLPSGIGPEGYVTIPERNLLISANETDDAGARAHVMIFEYQEAAAVYPHLTSAGMDELTGWGAISGQVMAADGTIYAVSDSFYGMQPTIFHIDVSEAPARIVDAIRVTREGAPAQLMDMEGIALDGEGGFWIASEGRSDRLVPHAIYHVGGDGAIEDYITLPEALSAVEVRYGFEGITRVDDMLYVAVQREWRDDPENHAKVLGYNLETEEWSVIHYPLTEPTTGWVGLSEIVAHGDHVYFVERDNQHDTRAVTKVITRVPMSAMEDMVDLGETPAVLDPELVVDLLPHLRSTGGYVLDKVEGLTIAEDGTMWVSTDNDGVDDHSGETMFFSIAAE
ncbi:esterase-like activity of phytase family protein [Palleronia sp. LCG004]|uniref:esterase-like activity of phytase family protein n=1 Tax=Palleronia sp. LCG004 TaxID=3079304 RepID=UPI002943B0D8|nr:esterase-like activity of phytase family protein [Palleronia sp. LCG004]WOI57927.1 esterase-like activity of phytase family protein [Palleronia sp. LCG004]